MNHQRTVDKVSAGRPALGEFWLPELDDCGNASGTLQWDPDRGTELTLLDAPDPWRVRDLNRRETVMGHLSDGALVTLPNAWVRGYNDPTPGIPISSMHADSLLLGANAPLSAQWQTINFYPAHLHGWYPVTGITFPDSGPGLDHVVVDWQAEEPIEVELPNAKLQIIPTMQTEYAFSPDHSIRTLMRVRADPHAPMTLGELERQYLTPMMAFTTFVAARWDTPTYESVYHPDLKETVRVLHAGHTVKSPEWKPKDRRYLFLAEDCADIGEVLQRWFELDQEVGMPLRAFAETYRDGNTYTQGRLIGLVTALEGYCKVRTGKKGRSFLKTFKRLRDHADLDPELIGCRDDQLELLWHARNYYTHLGPQGGYSSSQLEEALVDCCRNAAALMQACLLRDLGFSTKKAAAMLEKHYQSWPLPSEEIEPADPNAPK